MLKFNIMKTIIKRINSDNSRETIAEFDQLVLFNTEDYISIDEDHYYSFKYGGTFYLESNTMIYLVYSPSEIL